MILDIVLMAARSLLARPLRSLLTLSGIAIGITAVVAMSALIQGVDRAISSGILAMNPRVLYLTKFIGRPFASRQEWLALFRRPDITAGDLRAIDRSCEKAGRVDVFIESGYSSLERRGQRSREASVLGVGASYLEVNAMSLAAGRFFTAAEVARGARVMVLGAGVAEALFPRVDPVGKALRLEGQEYLIVGTLLSNSDVGGFNLGGDNFAVIPHRAHARDLGSGGESLTVAMIPREDETVEALQAEVEDVMRVRHRLRADQDDDFDFVTQESILELWRNLSGSIFLAALGISSIALLVGGVGVLAVMTVSVTERMREIGVRRAIGARRRHILLQFLVEAGLLTGTGGALGSALGAAAAWLVSLWTEIPVALPWTSFAVSIASSTAIGVVFGLLPAWRASRLHPVEVLRYE